MALCPFAVQRRVKRFQEPMPSPKRVNAHTAVTSALSLFGYFNTWGNPCSHFFIREDGTVEQYIPTNIRAAADLQGNPDTISIETWDGYPNAAPGYWAHNGDVPPWNAAQMAALARLYRWLYETHPTLRPLLALDSVPGSTSHGLSYHRLGIDPWRVSGGLRYSNSRGKPCPGPRRILQLPEIREALKSSPTAPAKPRPTPKPTGGSPVSKFVSPVEGRVSSHWGARIHPITRARGFHRGIDIAAPRGTRIRAAYGGTVRAISRSLNLRGNAITGTWNSGRFILIDGPGGGSEWYGHVNTIRVKPGQRVKAGQIIGTVGDTGNVTGPHLHFETWNGRTQGGGAGRGNTRNPMSDFRKYGVAPGSASKVKVSLPTKPKPKPPAKAPGSSKAVLRVQKILAPMGYYHGALDGIPGDFYRRGTTAYQRAQRYAPGLKADGVWGPATEAHYRWTRRLQQTLNKWRGRKIKVDGDHGNNTRSRVGEVMRNNRGRSYRGALDSIPGPVFARMLGIPAHPGA